MILFSIALIIMGVVTAALYFSFQHLKEQQQWVDHTYTVINKVETILSELKDVQSSQRGFVITGQDAYLEPYNEAVPTIEATFKELDQLIQDNPAQEARLKILKAKADLRIDIAQRIIDNYRKDGQAAAFTLIKNGLGKIQMDEIRSVVRDMTAEESHLLNLRQDAVNRTADNTLLMGAGGLVCCFSILFFVFTIMYRETMRRAAVEASLHTAFKQMKEISYENDILSKMSDYFQSCKSPEEAFEIISVNIQHLLPNTYGTIAIFNNSRNIIETKLFWGKKSGSLNEYQSDDCWALRRGRIHHVHEKNSVEPICSHVTGNHHGAYLCIPMQAHGDIIGTFFIGSETEEALDDHKCQIAQTASEQVSLALANLKLQEKLRQQSIRDPMTNLYNRRYMEETMEREVNRAAADNLPLHILMLDIDHFKRFNDTFGHDAGDLLIKEFARMIQKKTSKDIIACRYGGEEFLVMMLGHLLEEATEWAVELGNAVRVMRVESNGQPLSQITISMGLSSFPDHGQSPAQLMHNADVALYKAKKGGRDQLVTYDYRFSNEEAA